MILILLASIVSTALRADTVKNLPPNYSHWLTEEVPYIIESQERKEFLALHTDAERDAFIRSFWDSRNPDPGSETNSYKETYYQRLAYVNSQFGNPGEQDGWKTDMGEIYLRLGEPKSKVTYPNSRNVRPIVIWFYQAISPALPPYFSVIFYKRSIGEPYTLYSPYQDGPSRLVTGLEALNDQKRSLKELRKSLGDEVARTTLSLLPSEPVDLENYSPSMVSDSILATIHGLADTSVEIERVNNNRRREKVTTSILSGSAAPEVSYSVSRDKDGRSTVDYFIRSAQPDSSLVGMRKTGGTGYDLTLKQHITTEKGTQVYDTVSSITAGLLPAQAEVAHNKVFAVEDQLALEPGKYSVESTLTNNLSHEAHRFTTAVVVPIPSKSLAISTPVVYSGNPSQVNGPRLPFTYAAIRFAPQGVRTATLHSGDPMRCVFQLWLPKGADGKPNRSPIAMHYYYGSILTGKLLAEADEIIDPKNADDAGNFVTGHQFPTDNLNPESYRVIIRATQDGSPPAFATMTLRIVSRDVQTAAWSAYGPPEPQQDEMKRAISAEAIGNTAGAITLLIHDLDMHPQNMSSLARLAALLAEQRKINETAQLVERPAFTNAVDMSTLTLVTEALVLTGKPDRAMDLLNRQSKLQALNAMLYTQLATLDDKAGKRGDADIARKLASEQHP